MGLETVTQEERTDQTDSPSIPDESDTILVCGYVRISTQQQLEDESHIRQRETIERWAEDNVEEEYEITFMEDLAISGQSDEREGYNMMMESLEELDVVVVRELSRFGRSLKKILKDVEKMREHDVDFVSIKDKEIDTSSAQGKLLFHIIAAFNQFWSDLAQERSEEMIQRRKEEGKPIGRPTKLSDDQMEELYAMRQAEGYSYATLKAIAESKGWVSTISRDTIRRNMKMVEEGK